MANCNVKYNKKSESFGNSTEQAKGAGWALLAVLVLAGIIAIVVAVSKLS